MPSAAARRSVAIGVLALALAVAVVTFVLAGVGREGWLLVGEALTLATGAATQIVIASRTDTRVPVSPRARARILFLAAAAVTFLIVAGVTATSAFTRVLVVVFLVALAFTVSGSMRIGRRSSRATR